MLVGTEGSSLEACHNVPQVTSTAPPPAHPPSPTIATSALTKGLHPAFKMHNTNRSYLPSQMFSAVVPGVTSPALPPSSTPQASAEGDSTTNPAFDTYQDGGGGGNVASTLAHHYSRPSRSDLAKVQSAASLAFASRLQEGFPYGISGVPSMPSYGYGNDLYNYVTNGFPRKSRMCSYCNKVFTRSTTRRYHERRCPLMRAAGSLAKGNVGNSMALPASSEPSSDTSETCGPWSSSSRPPPLIAATAGSPPPSVLSTSTSTSSSTATSMSLASLNASHFYSMYGSLATTMSTSATTLASSAATAQSRVDQNRNSVLSAVKKEPDQEMRDVDSHRDDANRESDLLRDKFRSQNEEQGQRQHSFTPLPANSPSPPYEDKNSLEGEQLPFRPPVSVNSERDVDVYRQFYYSQIPSVQAAKGMADGNNTSYFPAPFATNMTSLIDKASAQAGVDVQDVTDEKEEDSFRDEDSNCQEDEDTDQYSYSNPNMDVQEPDELDEEMKKCGICKMEFTLEENLVTHKRDHQTYKPSSCRFCGEKFNKFTSRIGHERLHTIDYSLGCVVCGSSFLTKFALRQHIHRRHFTSSAEETICRYCQFPIENAYNLRAHFQCHRRLISKSERLSILYLPSPLRVCVESPVEEEASQDHPPPSTDSKTSQESPGEVRLDPPALRGPITSVAAKVAENNPCKVNGGSESGSSKEKDWCRICQKEFPKSFMRHHEKEHADQKPYECAICKKRFGYKNNMKSHVKLHAGIKPYQCGVCFAKFTRGSTLRRHSRRHQSANNTTAWDLFMKKSRARDVLLSQATGAVRDAALTAATKSQSQGSSPVAGSRAMKADPALMASMSKAEMALTGKSYSPRVYSPSNPVPQNLFNVYGSIPPSVTQAMFQSCMMSPQYLGYATGFPSSVPPSVPQQAPQSDALDFSMPNRKRRKSSPSMSNQETPAASQGPTVPTCSESESSPASSYTFLPTSSGVEGGRQHSSQGDNRARDRGEENLRSSDSFLRHQYHHKQRASLGETVERLMESRTNRDSAIRPVKQDFSMHQSKPRLLNQDLSIREAALRAGVQDLNSHQNTSRTVVQDLHTHQTASQSSVQDMSTHQNAPQPVVHDLSSRQYSSHDFSSQVSLCCTQSTTASSDEDQAGQDTQDRTHSATMSTSYRHAGTHDCIASLVTSGRLFHCEHCDCYFEDDSMYMDHKKFMHLMPDHPFVCFVCKLDCQDRTNLFSHMLTHLR